MSYELRNRIIAFPDIKTGKIRIRDLNEERSRVIEAHRHPVKCLAMDFFGRYIASASTKGTIIRVFRTDTRQVVQEMRRGTDDAVILSLNFNLNADLLGCSSDSGTIHIFKVTKNQDLERMVGQSVISSTSSGGGGIEIGNEGKKENKKSKLRFLRKAIPYFDSEWSLSQMRFKFSPLFVNFSLESKYIFTYGLGPIMYLASYVQIENGKRRLRVVKAFNLEKNRFTKNYKEPKY